MDDTSLKKGRPLVPRAWQREVTRSRHVVTTDLIGYYFRDTGDDTSRGPGHFLDLTMPQVAS